MTAWKPGNKRDDFLTKWTCGRRSILLIAVQPDFRPFAVKYLALRHFRAILPPVRWLSGRAARIRSSLVFLQPPTPRSLGPHPLPLFAKNIKTKDLTPKGLRRISF